MDITILRAGTYRFFGDATTEITPAALREMADKANLDLPFTLRDGKGDTLGHACGRISRFWVTDDGQRLMGDLSDLTVSPAFMLDSFGEHGERIGAVLVGVAVVSAGSLIRPEPA